MSDLIVSEDDMAELKTAKPTGINMNIQYWSPENVGDQKCVMLLGYLIRKFPDKNKPDIVRDVPCAVIVDAEGTVYENGSAILVSCLKEHFKQGDKVCIEYAGTKKSAKGNNCANWKVIRMESGK